MYIKKIIIALVLINNLALAQNTKVNFSMLMSKCQTKLPYINSRIIESKGIFVITEKSLLEYKKLFANFLYDGNMKKLIKKSCSYNQDTDERHCKDEFKMHAIDWKMTVGNYKIVSISFQNDTILEDAPGGESIPYVSYYYLCNNEGKILDKLISSGYVTYEFDNIESFINKDYTIDIYNYLPNEDSYIIKNNTYYKKKDAKMLSKVIITKYKIDEKIGKFVKVNMNINLLKFETIRYRNFNTKESSDDPMLKLPKAK